MRISDWSSDVCSSDLQQEQDDCYPKGGEHHLDLQYGAAKLLDCARRPQPCHIGVQDRLHVHADLLRHAPDLLGDMIEARRRRIGERTHQRSEEHTSELQSLMRISYAVFCLKKKKKQ